MSNRAYLEDDIVHQVYDGDQDGASMQGMVGAAEPFVQQMLKQKKPILVLADATTVNKASLHARQSANNTLKNRPYDKIAIFGASTYIRHICNLVIAATGQGDRVKLFKTEDEAKIWLKAA